MSWLSTCTRTFARFLPVMCLLIAPLAGAQNLESALMPGKLIKGHADLEADCKNCHVRFDRGAQTRLCLACHKPVAADVTARTGHHGRITERECRACHTDHKGRDANIVRLDERGFDHARTDFALAGKHRQVACNQCHKAGSRHRETAQECIACHRKDDRHKGALGAQCQNCHNPSTWKEAKFDHQKTRFPLAHKHAQVRCAECHVGEHYAGTQRECVACHRKDDHHKGLFGTRCESCHTDSDWKTPTFRHERDTRFPLREKHRMARCESCHKTSPYRDKTPTACVACHKGDDAHKGSLGTRCESCHTEARWKAGRFDHDRETRFPLRERHRTAKCEVCHTDTAFREKPPQACNACHAKDDQARGHKGNNGERCETCHTEKNWRETTFQHDRATRFALLGKHAGVKCEACHTGPVHQQKLATDCHACHRKDDPHKERLGIDCQRCHVARGWKDTTFDHARTAFPLTGRHDKLACAKCHTEPTFKEAIAECRSCHARDDPHAGRFGTRCDQCHTTATWKLPDFDHNRHTRFPLEAAHAKVKCHECHAAPARKPGEPARAPTGRDLGPATGTACNDCHKKDDVHFGSFGLDCGSCHVPVNWRRVTRRPPGLSGTGWPPAWPLVMRQTR